MNRIAITGVSIHDRRIVSQVMSYLTGYDQVRQTAYACRAVKLNLNRSIEKCDWSDLFTYTLSAFTERIEIEQQFDTFISNGSVFHELAYMEASYSVYGSDHRRMEGYDSMYLTMKKIISEYAFREYDSIIHLNAPGKSMGDFLQDMDRSLMDMVRGCGKSFIVDNNSLLPDTLDEILQELQIKPLLPVKSALKRVGMEV